MVPLGKGAREQGQIKTAIKPATWTNPAEV